MLRDLSLNLSGSSSISLSSASHTSMSIMSWKPQWCDMQFQCPGQKHLILRLIDFCRPCGWFRRLWDSFFLCITFFGLLRKWFMFLNDMPSTICLKQRMREPLWTSSYLRTNYCIFFSLNLVESTLLTFGALRAVSNWPGRSAYKVPSFFCKPRLISRTNISRLLRLSVSNSFLGRPNKRCSAWSWHWRHLGAWHFQKTRVCKLFISFHAPWLRHLGLCPILYVAFNFAGRVFANRIARKSRV